MTHYIVVNNTMIYPDGSLSHTSPVGGRFKTLSNARRYATTLDVHKSWGIIKVYGIDEKYMGMVLRETYYGGGAGNYAWFWRADGKTWFLNRDGTLGRRYTWAFDPRTGKMYRRS